ncbi:MAG: hypothetical protein KC912_12920 [Proteobacteria bacterium]|nr:hypothetical protein [Pseudomonadota bacterium]
MQLHLRARIVLIQVVAVVSVMLFLALMLIPRLEAGAQQNRLDELESLARVVAYNASAPLYFLDEGAAAEAAEVARVDPQVRRVAIYDMNQELFAIAPEGARATPTLPFRAGEDTLIVQRAIGQEGDWVGVVVLEVGTEDLREQSASIRSAALLVGLAGVMLAFGLAWALEGVVSRRIIALSSAIDHVRLAEEGTFRVPVALGTQDEITDLGLRVNELLDAIELREAQLLATHQQLEHRVEERTAQLAATAQRTNAILQSLMDGLLVVDSHHVVTESNEAIRGLLGRDPVGEPLRAFLIPAHGELDDSLDQDVGRITQWTLVTDEAEPVPVEISIALIAGEGGVRSVLSIRDISERMRLDQLKADFVSTVSHELRTPITAVYGSLRLVLAGVTGPIGAASQGMLQRAFDNSERLIRLVNDLLDMQRVERGQLIIIPQPVQLDQLVLQAVEASQGYDPRDIPIRITGAERSCWVNADPDRIIQVLQNLLSNALKYSPDDGEIAVSLHPLDGRVRVVVTDQGPGIPPEFHDRIFSAFQQADSGPGRQKPGTGLGLAVSKAIIDGHGGSIGYESPPGEGATLWFELVTLAAEAIQEGSGPAAK